MVQISLFDFEAPPPAVTGEARTLSPLDTLIFTPTSTITKTGEKLTTGLLARIGEFFAPKALVLPAEKGLATIAQVGSRTPGAPFRLSGGTSSTSTANLSPKIVGNVAAPNTVKSSSSLFSSKLNPNIAVLGAGSGFALGTTALLTSTDGGQNLVNTAGDTVQGVTRFFTDNPLILAGLIVVGGIMVLKR